MRERKARCIESGNAWCRAVLGSHRHEAALDGWKVGGFEPMGGTFGCEAGRRSREGWPSGSFERNDVAGASHRQMSGLRSLRECSEAPFVANRDRAKVVHRGWTAFRRRETIRNLGVDQKWRNRSRLVRRDESTFGLDESRSSGWMSAHQVTTFAAVRRPEVLGSRSHLGSTGGCAEARLRRVARANDGRPEVKRILAGCCPGSDGRARPGLEERIIRPEVRPSHREARLHPTSTRGSGNERGTNRVHVFENRKKVGCKRPGPTRLGGQPGNGTHEAVRLSGARVATAGRRIQASR